jgi:hypothetical protein
MICDAARSRRKASAFPGREEAKPAGEDRTVLAHGASVPIRWLLEHDWVVPSPELAHTPFADFPTLNSVRGCETALTDRAAIREATALIVEPLEPKHQSAHQVHWVPDAVGFPALLPKDRHETRRIPRRTSEYSNGLVADDRAQDLTYFRLLTTVSG